MTDDDKALVERLRSLGPIQASSLFTVTIDRAADRIEAQAVEIERLREALRDIDRRCPVTCDMTLAHEMADIASAALGETE